MQSNHYCLWINHQCPSCSFKLIVVVVRTIVGIVVRVVVRVVVWIGVVRIVIIWISIILFVSVVLFLFLRFIFEFFLLLTFLSYWLLSLVIQVYFHDFVYHLCKILIIFRCCLLSLSCCCHLWSWLAFRLFLNSNVSFWILLFRCWWDDFDFGVPLDRFVVVFDAFVDVVDDIWLLRHQVLSFVEFSF